MVSLLVFLVFPSLSCSLALLLSLLLVFGVVRAQPCEHARYPRTPLCLRPIVLSSLFLFLFSPRPPFFFFLSLLVFPFVWNGDG